MVSVSVGRLTMPFWTLLLKIVDWLTANKLSLNVKKTNYIIFHPYQKRLNYDVNIKILDSRVNKYF